MPNRCYNKPCPCQGCTDRCISCHSACNKYKDWKSDVTEEPPSSLWVIGTPARLHKRRDKVIRRI